jgi:ubiquinone biosynthesis protein
MAFNELGPTFIKLGQVLSTRPDIVPDDVVCELEKLQDEVAPFPSAVAIQIISTQLGKPVAECFESIDLQPIASASIAQVHRALGKNGEKLCVKVRRPDVEDVLRVDMELLAWLAESMESYIPETRVYRPSIIVSELEQSILRELDFINEAASTQRFGQAFAEEPGIRVPKVYWEFTSPCVLTLQELPGVNVGTVLRDAPGAPAVDGALIAKRLTDCFLKQVLEVGLFHADPHPGNILVESPAYVGLIDFGQVGTVTEEWKTELIIIIYAAVNREVDVIIDALADMGSVGVDADRRSLHRSLQGWLDKYHGLAIKRFDLGVLLREFSEIIRRHDVLIPRDLIMLIKCFSTVGSTTQRLDPELNILELLKPRLKSALRERFSPKAVGRETALAGWHLLNVARQMPGQLRQTLRRLSAGGWGLDIHHRNLDRLINELDRSSNRLAFSIVIAAIIIGSSVVIRSEPELMVFGIVRLQFLGIFGYVVAGVLGLGLIWAIFRSGRLH